MAKNRIKRLKLKTEKKNFHPWIYSKMITHPNPKPKKEEIVEVVDKNSKFVGWGFYHPKNTISVRIISRKKEKKIDKNLIYEKIKRAKELRETLNINANSYRLFYSESDGISGLIIDKFDKLLVIEPYSAGILTIYEHIIWSLKKLFKGYRIAFKIDERVEKKEGVDFSFLEKEYPLPESVVIEENGVKYKVLFEKSHKTGFFFDQRENREFFGKLSKGKIVFDIFSYTGGFGLNALKNGAEFVFFVDLDEKVLEVLEENLRLNNISEDRYKIEHKDAFDFLREIDLNPDLISVDPSKFLSVKEEYSVALRKYGDINRLAIRKVKNGGIIATFSCSGMLSMDKFLSVVRNSAKEEKRFLQIIKSTSAGGDHPVLDIFPESFYLKGIFARVLDDI